MISNSPVSMSVIRSQSILELLSIAYYIFRFRQLHETAQLPHSLSFIHQFLSSPAHNVMLARVTGLTGSTHVTTFPDGQLESKLNVQ